MRKFFVMLTVALMLTVTNFAEAAVQFKQEHFDQMIGATVQNPAAVQNISQLPVNATIFQGNYNSFMKSFIKDTKATGDDLAMMEKIFLITEPKIFTKENEVLFAQNFSNKAMVIGLSKDGDKFNVLNFFAPKSDDKNDALFNALIISAFIKGIDSTYDINALFNEITNSPDATVIHNGIQYSISRLGDLEVMTAVSKGN